MGTKQSVATGKVEGGFLHFFAHVIDFFKRKKERTDGCCGFFKLFGHVLKVVLPNISPVSVEDAGHRDW